MGILGRFGWFGCIMKRGGIGIRPSGPTSSNKQKFSSPNIKKLELVQWFYESSMEISVEWDQYLEWDHLSTLVICCTKLKSIYLSNSPTRKAANVEANRNYCRLRTRTKTFNIINYSDILLMRTDLDETVDIWEVCVGRTCKGCPVRIHFGIGMGCRRTPRTILYIKIFHSWNFDTNSR